MTFVAVAIGGVAVAGIAGSAISAGAQSDAAASAQQIQAQQYAETKAALQKGEKQAQGYIQPYAGVGRNALDALAYGMGLSGGATNPWDIPTDAKIGKSNDPIWNYVLQQYKSNGGKIKGNLTDPKNADLLKQLQGQYSTVQQKQGATAGSASGVGQGSLLNYGQDQYKNDVGYTPMVNSLAELQATPGYQFQLEQGLQGVNSSAAAKGGLLSGANMKAINYYAQGQASTGYQAAWDRAQTAYGNAFGRNQQKFQDLQSMANNGQSAANTQGQYAMGTGQALAGASTNYGNNQSNLALGQGQIQANMVNGITGAISGGLMAGVGTGAIGGGKGFSSGGGTMSTALPQSQGFSSGVTSGAANMITPNFQSGNYRVPIQ